MMGGIPNYFQPFVAQHSSFTGRVETVMKHLVRIMHHMRRHGYDSVSIERKTVVKKPRITPNYVMRQLHSLPAIYGTLELPAIDKLLFFRFRPRDYRFARSLYRENLHQVIDTGNGLAALDDSTVGYHRATGWMYTTRTAGEMTVETG